jgi:hypothetical protein
MENKVSAMFAELPVGIDDPVERLHAITGQLRDLKESKQALAGEAITSLSGFAPPMLLSLGMRVAARAARRMGNLDTVTTNVPGPQFPLYSCGRRLLRACPYVPLAAPLRVGVSIFSYDGELTFGVTGDYDSAGDIDVLAGGIAAGVTELLPSANGQRDRVGAAGTGREASASTPGPASRARKATAGKATASKATTSKATAGKARKATARNTAGEATARKTTGRKSSARKPSARKPSARKSSARTPSAKGAARRTTGSTSTRGAARPAAASRAGRAAARGDAT